MDKQAARTLARGTKIIHSSLGRGTWDHKSSIDGPTAAWVRFDGQPRLTPVDFTQVELDEPRIECQTWDWKGNVDLEALARDIERVSRGTIFLYPTDTGSDDEGYVLSDRPLTPEQVRQATEYNPEGPDGNPV